MATLKEIFESIDIAAIRDYVSSSREEDLHLDFITIESPDMSASDRRNLAKALSGYANSDGGLIVWGVSARRNAEGVDCAVSLHPVANAALLLTRLNDLTGECVTPLVDGVAHRRISESGGAEGFCVSIIPASDSGPHMAKAREDRYFKRAGSSFYRLEHFDLADMFGRRPSPVIDLSYRLVRGGHSSGPGGKTFTGDVIVGLANSGRGAAHFPYLAATVSAPHRVSSYGLDGNGNNGLPRLVSGGGSTIRFGANSDVVIHPGVTHDVTKVHFEIRFDHRGEPLSSDFHAVFEYAAQGVPLRRQELAINAAELIASFVT